MELEQEALPRGHPALCRDGIRAEFFLSSHDLSGGETASGLAFEAPEHFTQLEMVPMLVRT
jgi:hypothetical protein